MARSSVITRIIFPVISMAVADTKHRYLHVGIGSYGKDSNSTILKRSTLWKSIQTNMLELPSERPLAGTEGPNVPYCFVGDEGFALNRNILRPFGGSNLSVKNNVYKYRLCRAQSYVERAFVILSNNGEFSSDRLMSVLNLQWTLLRPVLFCTILFARKIV